MNASFYAIIYLLIDKTFKLLFTFYFIILPTEISHFLKGIYS